MHVHHAIPVETSPFLSVPGKAFRMRDRYVLPGSGSVTVLREASSWSVPTSSNA
jgi:hypothetical protein